MEPTVQFLPIIVIAISVIAYLLLSVRIIGPTETGIVVRLGNPIGVKKSGICFFLRGIYKIVKYPTKQYNFTFPERKMITKRGEYDGERYEAAALEIDAVIYLRWPQDKKLIDSYRTAPPPGIADVLSDFFEEEVVGTLREIVAENTWREVIENRKTIADKVTDELKKDPTGPFCLAGISDIDFVIKEVTLPQELQDALTLPQIEELRMRAVKQDAQAERSFIEAQGKAFRSLGAWGPLAALLALVTNRKTPTRR